MQLSDILEEQSVKSISKKTRISEENLEALFEKKFDKMERVKLMGFLSILEREYGLDLNTLREEAVAYYTDNTQDRGFTVSRTAFTEKRGKPKWFVWSIAALFIYTTWYFIAQYDRAHLNTLLSQEQKNEESLIADANQSEEDFIESIKQKWESMVQPEEKVVNMPAKEETNQVEVVTSDIIIESSEDIAAEENITTEMNQSNGNQEEVSTEVVAEANVTKVDTNTTTEALVSPQIALVPAKKIWFGVIDIASKKRDHHLVSEAFPFVLGAEGVLVATSSAGFTLVNGEEKRQFNDAKVHYFKIDQSGIVEMSKTEYVASGGWNQW